MPRKKIATKKKATVSKAMVPQNDFINRMREKVGNQKAREVAASNYIRVDNGRLMHGETELPSEFEAVILDFGHFRGLYEEDFDPKNPSPPSCFALNMDQTQLAPHDTVPDKKADSCAECEYGAWVGSTPPDCSERRILALVDNDPENDEIYKFAVSPAGLKAWKKYVTPFINQDLRTCFLKTIISVDIDPDRLGNASGKVAAFDFGGYIEGALAEKVERLYDGAEQVILAPPEVARGERPGKKKVTTKKAVKKVRQPVRRAKV